MPLSTRAMREAELDVDSFRTDLFANRDRARQRRERRSRLGLMFTCALAIVALMIFVDNACAEAIMKDVGEAVMPKMRFQRQPHNTIANLGGWKKWTKKASKAAKKAADQAAAARAAAEAAARAAAERAAAEAAARAAAAKKAAEEAARRAAEEAAARAAAAEAAAKAAAEEAAAKAAAEAAAAKKAAEEAAAKAAAEAAAAKAAVAQAATDAYDAGKTLAGNTYSQTLSNVRNKFGDAKVNAYFGNQRDMLQNKYDSAKGFTDAAVNDMKSEVKELRKDLVGVAEMVVAFFNGLNCNIGPSTMTSFTTSLKNAFKSSGTADLVNKIKNEPSRFYRDMDAATCDLIWNTVFTSSSAAITTFGTAIKTLKSDCPALGGANPAFTLGFTLDVDVTFASRTGGIGTEIGVGFDMTGQKFCYVGGCVTAGRTFGSNSAANADLTPGLALSGYKELTSVPGECSLLDVGIDINLPTPIKVEGGGGLTYLYGGGMGDFVGLSYPMELGAGDPVPGADVSIKRGMCCTPICLKTDGTSCAPTNWKNPCPTMADPNAYLNLISASWGGGLGGERTLDMSHEDHTKYYRRIGDPKSHTYDAISERLSQSTIVASVLTISVLALAIVAHRRRVARKITADESTPLLEEACLKHE